MTTQIRGTKFDATTGAWPHNFGPTAASPEGAPLGGIAPCPLGSEHGVRDAGRVDGIGPLAHLPHHRLLATDGVAVDRFALGESALAADNHSGRLAGLIAGDADLVLLRSLDRSGFSGMSRVDLGGVTEESVSVDHCELVVGRGRVDPVSPRFHFTPPSISAIRKARIPTE